MRLKIPMTSANETLMVPVNRDYGVLTAITQDYTARKNSGGYKEKEDNARNEEQVNQWASEVASELSRVFPTELERNLFLNPEIPLGAVSSEDYKYQSMIRNFKFFVRGIETIRQTSLVHYTDLAIQDRLYVEDIDSFQKVRDVNPAMVTGFLKNGFLGLSEDAVQLALEQILG